MKRLLPYTLAAMVGLACAGAIKERADRDRADVGRTVQVTPTVTSSPDLSEIACDADGCWFVNQVGGR
ncbi:hypothetical protein [Nonomuraea ceibae]|uniref:hypothetical protein n=1 Tax=Nonomuraea ceibae TaxID=1935170 RepID=UPI001C5FC169|nr:hypothetical protein [Nonomuraea ceibae]